MKGTIDIKTQVYRLSATDNKREFIYKNNTLVDTKAFKL